MSGDGLCPRCGRTASIVRGRCPECGFVRDVTWSPEPRKVGGTPFGVFGDVLL